MKKLLNIHEAAAQLDKHPDTVRKMLRRGELAGIKGPGIRAAWKVEPAAIDRWIGRNRYHAA